MHKLILGVMLLEGVLLCAWLVMHGNASEQERNR